VRAFLDEGAIGYTVVPRLVRGLDYYIRTAFEIVSGELGSQNALAGGGRYDGLSKSWAALRFTRSVLRWD